MEGQVTSLTPHAFTARFAPDSGFALPLGTRLSVGLVGRGQQVAHEARVVRCESQDGWVEYGLEAVGNGRFTLTGARERRAAPRVALTDHEAVSATLTPYYEDDAFEPIEAQVADVSRHGLCLVVPGDADLALFACGHVRVAVTLPGEAEALRFVGEVRHRRFHGLSIRYGIELDPARSESYPEHLARLGRFVVRRQLEQVRRTHRWERAS